MTSSRAYTNPVPPPSPSPGWTVATIDELCTRVTSGSTPLRTRNEYYENGTVDWFKTKELKDEFLEYAEEKITQRALDETAVKLFPPNTVLMAMYGDGRTITSLGILRNPAASNQACCAMIADPAICDFRYLFYALKYHRTDFLRIATGGAQRNLSGQLIRNFAFQVPPLVEQRTIASILGALDDKIELNRRMNATLEAMARTIFQSWFVDFDPVRAKAEGREIGLPAEIAALFPDRFVESELGEIPAGWNLGSIGDIAHNLRRTLRPEQIAGDTAYIGLEHMPQKSIALAEWGNAANLGSNKYAFESGAILFGKLRPYFHKVGFAPCSGVCSTDILVIVPKEPNLFATLLGHISSVKLIEFVNASSTGTRMPRTSWEEIARYRIALPNNALTQVLNDTAMPLIRRIRSNIYHSRTLAIVRNTLLPQLISGRLCVADAEGEAMKII